VHTTQFAIRHPSIGLFKPVLELAVEELKKAPEMLRIGGICGASKQAVSEAKLLFELGYDAGLLSLGALKEASEPQLIDHCRAVSEIIPVVGFYLQPAVGGRILPFSFWRNFAEIENVVAVKIAAFNRYQTIDVIRAIVESGREDIALYTGNDDNILLDLITPFAFQINGRRIERRIVGGLLGHWAVWTSKAVELLEQCHELGKEGQAIPAKMLQKAIEITDANAAFFDAANGFAGCIPGIHEVLRRQGLLEEIGCLDPAERLSPGQNAEIDRVYKAYPGLNDDRFIQEHLHKWLEG
jgi:dihydrodipicolinate synthase/N-acetylneuraminate lyase